MAEPLADLPAKASACLTARQAQTDVSYDPDSIQVSYESDFNRYFYKTKSLQPLEEIRADLPAVEKYGGGDSGGW